MARRISKPLTRLEELKFSFDRQSARTKRELLLELEQTTLARPDEVLRLHEHLCFMRAYPDDRPLLTVVERMLDGFETREDLDRHRSELADSGIAGTQIRFPFFWFTLDWVARHWPERLHVDWSGGAAAKALLDRRLSILMPYCETLALEEAVFTTREWIENLKGPDETDGAFVAARYRALSADPMPRESLFEEMDLWFRLLPGPDTPTNTHNRRPVSRVAFQTRPFAQTRKTFHRDLLRPPKSVRSASPREARELIEMARVLMIVRSRDLDCFVHAADYDVRVLDYGNGLQFVAYGSRVERRQMLDAAYGFLMLKNGAPIGYVLSAALFGSAEVAFNVSPAFRGAEATRLYAQTLSMIRHLFDVDTFMIDPYQMGHENLEGLRSGAWWFYYKLGFRPRDPAILRLVDRETAKIAADPRHRTSIATLNRLSSVNMYLHLGEPREDVLGLFARENPGLRIMRCLAERFGADRERGVKTCAREAASLLGLRSLSALPEGERTAWERWSPLVLQMPGIRSWPLSARKALARVVRAKGGRRESDFVRLFDRHDRARRALLDLAREPPALPVD